jgi:AAA15 family ATPase/GTPase
MLVGANASGKSNLIEALRLLSWLSQGNKLSAVRFFVQENDRFIRGRVPDLFFNEETLITFKCQTDSDDWNNFELSIELRAGEELHIINEKITDPITTVPLYEVVSPSTGNNSDIQVAYNNFARGGRKPQITCHDQTIILEQIQSPSLFSQSATTSREIIPTISKGYQEVLSNIVFLDPQPSAMRSYAFEADERLEENGSNLSAVLSHICSMEGGREKILKSIESLPEQRITDIGFISTPRNEVMLQLVETFGHSQTSYEAPLLSDGTLRVLSIAAALFSAPKEAIVVIEEIDNGVHPSRAKALLENILEEAKNRNLRVVLSSHNPALLDALPDESIPNVVFCYRSVKDGSSELVQIGDLERYPELLVQGDLGELVTKGILERFVKRSVEPNKRIREALDYLEKMD